VKRCTRNGCNLILSIVAGVSLVPFYTSVLWAEDSLYSYNNFGGVGLLDMRTARFAPDGTLAVGIHYNSQLTRYFATWQVTPWLETTLSYTDENTPSGPFSLRLNVPGIDRSLDVKVRLLTESNYRPQLAFGIQDAR